MKLSEQLLELGTMNIATVFGKPLSSNKHSLGHLQRIVDDNTNCILSSEIATGSGTRFLVIKNNMRKDICFNFDEPNQFSIHFKIFGPHGATINFPNKENYENALDLIIQHFGGKVYLDYKRENIRLKNVDKHDKNCDLDTYSVLTDETKFVYTVSEIKELINKQEKRNELVSKLTLTDLCYFINQGLMICTDKLGMKIWNDNELVRAKNEAKSTRYPDTIYLKSPGTQFYHKNDEFSKSVTVDMLNNSEIWLIQYSEDITTEMIKVRLNK